VLHLYDIIMHYVRHSRKPTDPSRSCAAVFATVDWRLAAEIGLGPLPVSILAGNLLATITMSDIYEVVLDGIAALVPFFDGRNVAQSENVCLVSQAPFLSCWVAAGIVELQLIETEFVAGIFRTVVCRRDSCRQNQD
jgi:hypothetical protein